MEQSTNSFWHARSPVQKTLLTGGVIECIVFLVLFAITRSALSSVICSVGFFGPASIVIGPSILRRFERASAQGVPMNR
jgi:hypothetical protein